MQRYWFSTFTIVSKDDGFNNQSLIRSDAGLEPEIEKELDETVSISLTFFFPTNLIFADKRDDTARADWVRRWSNDTFWTTNVSMHCFDLQYSSEMDYWHAWLSKIRCSKSKLTIDGMYKDFYEKHKETIEKFVPEALDIEEAKTKQAGIIS